MVAGWSGRPAVALAASGTCRPTTVGSAIELRGHEGEVGSVWFSPAAAFSRMVAGSPSAARIESSGLGPVGRRPGQPSLVLRGLEGEVAKVTFDDRGRWLAAGGVDGSAQVWDMERPPGSVHGAPTWALTPGIPGLNRAERLSRSLRIPAGWSLVAT